MIVGCIDIPKYPIEEYTGFIVDVVYLPETFWDIDRTIITFSDGNVLILRGIQGIPRNHTVTITYYKKEWNNEPYYPFISMEVIK